MKYISEKCCLLIVNKILRDYKKLYAFIRIKKNSTDVLNLQCILHNNCIIFLQIFDFTPYKLLETIMISLFFFFFLMSLEKNI